MNRPSVAGTILAGGRSSRMAGGDKAWASLAGKPLLQHALDRVGPQVDELALSVEAPSRALEAFGLPQLPDPVPGHQGPLGGLLSALRHFADRYEWLLLVPCDAPFLPLDLALRLHARATETRLPCAVPRYQDELQPTFSLWHNSLLAVLEEAVIEDGLAGFKQFLARVRAARCDWPAVEPGDAPPPFFNVNDDQALRQAELWMGHSVPGRRRCSA